MPVHPAIVHLPLGLAAAAPIIALALAIAVARGVLPRGTWAIAILLQVLLVAGGFFAMEAGEDEAERVERIVGEKRIDEHEERAEMFAWTAAVVLVIQIAALLPRSMAGTRAVLTLSVIATVIVAALAYRTGESGGELVYRHGAASAYAQPPPVSDIDED